MELARFVAEAPVPVLPSDRSDVKVAPFANLFPQDFLVRLQVQGSISLAPGGDVLRGVVDQCAIDVEQEDTGPHAFHCPGMVHSADGHLVEQG